MASAENDESEEPAPGDGGSGDWTQWLRSRLERVAAPERRQDVAASDQPKFGEDRAGAGAGAPPAPRLPPSEQEPGPDLGLRLQWPSHPLEPSAGGRGRTAENRGPEGETAGGDPPAAPASPEGPAAPSDAPATAQDRPLPRIDAPVARSQTPPAARPDTPPAPPDEPAPGPQGAGDERPASSREAAPAPAQPGARPPSRLAEPPAAVPSHELIAGLDRLQVAVSSLSARVDGLADATHTFRSVMNERLDEYTETVLRAAKSSASDLQEYRRMHTASLGEVRRNANETAETLRRLTGWMEELARIQGDDERWATALSQAFEEAAAERREGEERDPQLVSTLTERLERIDQALGRMGEELAAEPADPLLPVVRSLAERLERMEQALDGLAAQAGQPLPPPLVLDDDAVDAIAAAVAERLDAPPPAAAPEPQPTTRETTSRTSSPDATPAAPARGRRTTPIRAPSRSRSGR